MALLGHEAGKDCRAEGSPLGAPASGRARCAIRGDRSEQAYRPFDPSRASGGEGASSPRAALRSGIAKEAVSSSQVARAISRSFAGGAGYAVTVYVDSSVLLRIVLGEPGALREWSRITRAVSSELIRLECLRTIDRARIRHRLDDKAVAQQRAAVLEQLEGFEIIPLETGILERAEGPFPTLLGSLDAIHLAIALLTRAQVPDLRFATHYNGLAIAARAVGFSVLGCPASRNNR